MKSIAYSLASESKFISMYCKSSADVTLQSCLGDRSVILKVGSRLVFRHLSNGCSSILVVPPGNGSNDFLVGSSVQLIESDCKMQLRLDK